MTGGGDPGEDGWTLSGTEAAGDVGRYRHLVEHIQDAVVEFELAGGEPIVVDVNEAFTDVFGHDLHEIEGDSLNEWIVPEWLADEATELDTRTSAGEVNYQRVKRETASGLREFLYRGIPFPDAAGRRGGFAVYTDLTEIVQNERRLQVLTRVLRHNLRNRANVISANTSRLLAEVDTTDPTAASVAATVESAAADLVALADEAGTIRRILDRGPDTENASVDCVPLIEAAVRDFRRENPHATIETSLPESMTVRGNQTLSHVIESLVDNAIVHNTSPDPHVRVRAQPAAADGWARIDVEDDAPTIPPAERRVVEGTDAISQTTHGSGLGLWIVRWTIELFGGRVSFASSDLGGNAIQLTLPRRPV